MPTPVHNAFRLRLRVKPILAIEQDPTLPGLGLLGRVVRARGLPIVSAHAWEGDLDGLRASDFGGIVPLGGSMQSWDEERLPFLARERALLREAVDEGVPVLGICLGGQVLARALGAEARPAERPEVGWLRVEATPEAAVDPLLSHLREPVGVYQWHLDVFDLPDGRRASRAQRAERESGLPLRRAHVGPAVPSRGRPSALPRLDQELGGRAGAHGTRPRCARGVDRSRLARTSPSRSSRAFCSVCVAAAS